MPPQQQQRDSSEAKGEPMLVDLLSVVGEGAAEQQLPGQQQLQQPREQLQQSGDCYTFREGKVLVPPLEPSQKPPRKWPPPPSPSSTPPPHPLMPLLLTSSTLTRPCNVRDVPGSVGQQEEQQSEDCGDIGDNSENGDREDDK